MRKITTYQWRLLSVALIFVILILTQTDVAAQCPMCRIGAETNLARGGSEGKGLNKGILFLLSLPYMLVGTVGFIWWRKNHKK